MVTALDVANYFIDAAKDSEDPMTDMRVNRYVYLAQGYTLAKLNRPLFNDEIEAWDRGPIVPQLYQLFKSDRNGMPIYATRGVYRKDIFSDDELQVMIDVLMDYSGYSTTEIFRMTCGKNSPWSRAYSGKHIHSLISLNDMETCFSKGSERSLIERYAESRQDPGYIDADGHYVLPSEFDYDE